MGGNPSKTDCEIKGVGIIGARMPLPQGPNMVDHGINEILQTGAVKNRTYRVRVNAVLSPTLRGVIPSPAHRYDRRRLLLCMDKVIKDSFPRHQIFVRPNLGNLTVV